MAIEVTINGNTYSIPEQGNDPPWGESLSDLLQALVDVANIVSGTGDISNTSIAVNNTATTTDVTGLQFDPLVIRSAIISYSLYRKTDSTEKSECGQIYITYKNITPGWEITNVSTGDASVVFSITTAGQVQYNAAVLAGSNYSGTLRFMAKAFTQS